MKFGLGYANTIPFTAPDAGRDLAQAAEETGFDSIWTVEHVIWPHQYDSEYPYHPSGKMPGQPSLPVPDPLTWLTWIGAATQRLLLGTGVMILPLHNPLVLAKQTATLDYLTGGRLLLGVGAGWLEEEFDALGVEFAGRGRRVDEMIGAMRRLWKDDEATFQGDHVSFQSVAMNPKPVAGSIPIVVGGNSKPAIRRAAKLGEGYYPGPRSMDTLKAVADSLTAECEEIGRDPGEVELTAAFPGRLMENFDVAVEAMSEIGVDRIMVPVYEVTRPDLETGMARFAGMVT